MLGGDGKVELKEVLIQAWTGLFWKDILEEGAGEEASTSRMQNREGGAGAFQGLGEKGGTPGGWLGGRLGLMGAEPLETWRRHI